MRGEGNDTIEQVGPLTGTGQGYAVALGELWPGVQAALGRLNTIAGDPYCYDADALAGAVTDETAADTPQPPASLFRR